jgi:hypothetical protein
MAKQTEEQRKYPFTLAGVYKNDYSDKFMLNSMPLDQEQADAICFAIQQSVGGRIEVREWGGVSKAGKNLPPYKIEVLTAAQLEERKAYGAKKKAERDGDESL